MGKHKRLTLKELCKRLESLRGCCNFDSEVIVRIKDGKEYIIIGDKGLDVIITVGE